MLFHMWTWWKAFQYLEAARNKSNVWLQHHFWSWNPSRFLHCFANTMALLARDECEHPIFGAVVAAYSVGEGCGGTNGSNPNDCTSTIAHGWGMLNSLSCRICCVTEDLTCSLLMFLHARRKREPWGFVSGWLSGYLYNKFPKHPKLLLQGGMTLGVLSAFFYAPCLQRLQQR